MKRDTRDPRLLVAIDKYYQAGAAREDAETALAPLEYIAVIAAYEKALRLQIDKIGILSVAQNADDTSVEFTRAEIGLGYANIAVIETGSAWKAVRDREVRKDER